MGGDVPVGVGPNIGVGVGGGGCGETKVRIGDKLFERRDKCVELFSQSVFAQLSKMVSGRSTRAKIKAAHDDGIYRLFVAHATPTTRLFLDRGVVKERLVLTEDPAPTNTARSGKPARTVELLQYAQTEETLTKPVSLVHGLGVYLQPIEHTHSYGVWITWHRQPPTLPPAADGAMGGQRLRLNEGILNPTIPIGPSEGH
jgi:hypothetical protein